MKKAIYILWALILALSFSVSAEYKIYDNIEDFEKDKWSICEAATDGCNNFIMQDWKVIGWTKKYCADHTPEWNCTKYIEWSITTLSIPVTTTEVQDDPKICTMEYAPVCAKVQVQCIKAPCNTTIETFSNSCMAWDNEIVYSWTCDSKMSQNDISFYNSIKTSKLENKYQDRVYDILDKYKNIISKYSPVKQNRLNKEFLEIIDKSINDLLVQYPQDIALPKKVNNLYLMLKLLKFEIEILR